MEGVYFRNVPFGVTTKALVFKISEKLGKDCKNVLVNFYTSKDKQKRVATVSGFECPVSDVIPKLDNLRIGKFKLKAKYDRGDERDDFGDLLHPRSPKEMRLFKQLNNISSRKLKIVFTKRFADAIRGASSLQKPNLYCFLNGLNYEELNVAGKIVASHAAQRQETSLGVNFRYIEFQSLLEAIQAISMFNQKDGVTGQVIFTNSDGKDAAEISRKRGIGKNGSVINISEVVKDIGLIPFDAMDDSILNTGAFMNLPGKCWKCVSASRDPGYNLIGISPDLTYFGGRCQCDYFTDLPVSDIHRPFKHGKETFTRLSINRMNKGQDELMLVHDQMKLCYNGNMDFKDTTFPILLDEWKTGSTSFKIANTTTEASVVFYEFVETLEGSNEDINIYYVEIELPRTNFWNEDCVLAMRGITAFLEVKLNNDVSFRQEVRKCKIFKASSCGSHLLKLHGRLGLQKRREILLRKKIQVIPKPIKLEYQNTLRTINRMTNEKHEKKFKALQTIIAPSKMSIGPANVSLRNIVGLRMGLHRSYLRRLLYSLNTEQKTAVENAKLYEVSFVQGPPGTGKTYLAGVTSMLLALKEEGCILATSPSNYAADGLAISIMSTAQKLKIPIDVVRIYAKSRETQLMRDGINPLEDFGVKCLHGEVQQHPDWLIGEDFESIRKALQLKELAKLPSEDLKRLENHKTYLEMTILNRFQIFVTTIGCLADRRVMEWSQGAKIATILVDEAGQLKQTEMPFVLTFNQKRTVVYGDHLQLKPSVQSLAASLAGLEVSYMEWIDLGGRRAPWTLLKEQHRMNPGIRYLVSAVSYNHQLRDAGSISTRDDEIPNNVYQKFPDLRKNDILLYNYEFPETKGSGPSIQNKGEAEYVTMTVTSLLESGMEASNITVLTFYEAQKQLISDQLEKTGVAVANVDAFQGRENVLTIVCMTRSSVNGEIGFTKVINRVNVALSRAKFKMIMFCNMKTFSRENYSSWNKIMFELKNCTTIVNVPK